ncbi:MAG: type II toxin-antitoxin system RelE/ParE family toxin [Gammaproteobacteria bacterium]
MGWKIEFVSSAEKDLKKVGPEASRRIIRFLRERIIKLDNPRALGEPLHGPELGKFWKYRIGQYRIIASIEDSELVILVVRIGHRSQVYR